MNASIFLIILIVATVIISFKGFEDSYFFSKYQFHIGSIKKGDQIRMLSSGFLHADIAHLAFNMLSLYFFAPVVYGDLGNYAFLLIYFASLLFGNMLTLYIHNNDTNYSAIGASGAVTGIIYSAILLDPTLQIFLFFIPIPIPAYLFGIGYLLYSIYGMKAKSDNIGHTAHFGGAIGGYLFSILFHPQILQDNFFMVVILLVPIIIMAVMAKQGKL